MSSRKMKPKKSIMIKLLIIQYISVIYVAQGFDLFYLVLQWPGAICKTKASCCYSSATSDFTIQGLRPSNVDGTSPVNCHNNDLFNISKISDLKGRMQSSWPTLSCDKNGEAEVWSQAWKQEGTCSSYNQHKYFKIALDLIDKLNVLQFLKNVGINADGTSYRSSYIEDAIIEAFGYTPVILCSSDAFGKKVLSKVLICIDRTGKYVIDCSGLPVYRQCNISMVKFLSF